MRKIPLTNPRIFIILSLLFLCTVGYGEETFLQPLSDEAPGPENASGYFQVGGEIRVLLDLISMIGIDISYGTEGETIFSMVNSSLFQMVDDIASGNPEGMNKNLLIMEFFRYLGLNSSSFFVDYTNETLPLHAVKRFEDTYSSEHEHPDISPGQDAHS